MLDSFCHHVDGAVRARNCLDGCGIEAVEVAPTAHQRVVEGETVGAMHAGPGALSEVSGEECRQGRLVDSRILVKASKVSVFSGKI